MGTLTAKGRGVHGPDDGLGRLTAIGDQDEQIATVEDVEDQGVFPDAFEVVQAPGEVKLAHIYRFGFLGFFFFLLRCPHRPTISFGLARTILPH